MTGPAAHQLQGVKRLAAFAALSFILGACGDGESDTSTASAEACSGGESAGGSGGGVTLEISGTPPSQILAGQTYSFTPTVINPDNVAVTFSAANLPDWASIDASTGRITGTPEAGDVGTYADIRITVFGGSTSATTPSYSIEVVAVASGSATLTWTPPSENTDGSALTDLAGYKLYWGLSPSDLDNSVTIDNVGITVYIVEQLTPATWYFAATAFNNDGIESGLSNLASKTIL